MKNVLVKTVVAIVLRVKSVPARIVLVKTVHAVTTAMFAALVVAVATGIVGQHRIVVPTATEDRLRIVAATEIVDQHRL